MSVSNIEANPGRDSKEERIDLRIKPMYDPVSDAQEHWAKLRERPIVSQAGFAALARQEARPYPEEPEEA